jgi:hypothetical protein
MREVGIDISDRQAEEIELEMQLHDVKTITLNCQGRCAYVIGGIEDCDGDDRAGEPVEKVRESATTSNAGSLSYSRTSLRSSKSIRTPEEIREKRGGADVATAAVSGCGNTSKPGLMFFSSSAGPGTSPGAS